MHRVISAAAMKGAAIAYLGKPISLNTSKRRCSGTVRETDQGSSYSYSLDPDFDNLYAADNNILSGSGICGEPCVYSRITLPTTCLRDGKVMMEKRHIPEGHRNMGSTTGIMWTFRMRWWRPLRTAIRRYPAIRPTWTPVHH